jgi:hypothetical protein
VLLKHDFPTVAARLTVNADGQSITAIGSFAAYEMRATIPQDSSPPKSVWTACTWENASPHTGHLRAGMLLIKTRAKKQLIARLLDGLNYFDVIHRTSWAGPWICGCLPAPLWHLPFNSDFFYQLHRNLSFTPPTNGQQIGFI